MLLVLNQAGTGGLLFGTRGQSAPIVMLLVLLCGPAFGAACKVDKLAELPVTMDGLRPTVTAQINGADALFTLGSGAFWSMLTPAAAAQYKLRVDYSIMPGLRVEGVDGPMDAGVATVATFTIFNLPVRNVEFIVVGGNETGHNTVGLLGQNVLRFADVEYDLAHGAIRFLRPHDCKNAMLAYWLKSGEAYSLMDIERATPESPHTIGTAYLDGVKTRVIFDSGATTSVVSLRVASRAGIKTDGPGVEPDADGFGIGRRRIQTWIATFPSLKIGDEEIRNARLRFGDIGPMDFLLGADFFLSHRILVASSQEKLYFSYNGGPVFNLSASRSTASQSLPAVSADAKATATGAIEPQLTAAAASERSVAPATADSSSEASSGSSSGQTDTPSDAAGFIRRAAAFAARHDFEHALADYDRACGLAPTDADCFYRRSLVKLSLRQPGSALTDLDQALELKPDHVDALISRAALRIKKRDAAVLADLDAADRFATKQADIRLALGRLYEEADRLPAAIEQFDRWLSVHSQDSRAAEALNGRCWCRGLLGQQLDRALSDCNGALRLMPHSPAVLDSRGWVYLRSGKLDRAIEDFDAALRGDPRIAWSLYGRGIAKLRKGATAEGQADIAAATAISSALPERARQFGIVP